MENFGMPISSLIYRPSITDRYDINEMKMMLSFRKSNAPNELVFTESESTLRNTSTEWTVTNVTYNNRPYDIAGSPVVTRNVTSTGEENLSIDLSTIFQNALRQWKKSSQYSSYDNESGR